MTQEKFNSYYQKIWGPRWSDLHEALLQPERQVVRWNRWTQKENTQSTDPLCPAHCQWRDHFPEGYTPERGTDHLLTGYVMDPASVFVARSLPVSDGDAVLDLCAAPGGKSLILAENLVREGKLIANELSADRRDRLTKVIQNYIPKEVRSRVWVKGLDASLWGIRHPREFQAVLADVPCSGERHFLKSAETEWSEKRGQQLAHRQYAILCSALLACTDGGYFLYSTCSLNPVENDEIIRKFLKKKEGFSILPQNDLLQRIPGTEATEFGVYFLPDRLGFGPLYFCLFQKN